MSRSNRIGTDFAGYRIESLLGRGGMSVVYLAEHIRLGKKVALKVLAMGFTDEEFQARFTRESKLAATLDHPNVITIDDAGEFNGELYIAMRYVDGYDLGTLIKPDTPIPVGRTLFILEQIAGALDAAHRAGLVHRDVKPANILIDAASDRAYLSDFGIVKSTLTSGLATRTGVYLGTPQYSAPEQIEGKTVDARTDVYALGCVAYACLVGNAPYEREGEAALMNAHVSEPPPNLNLVRPDLPAALGHVIEKAMAKEKDDRYDSCLAFVNDMRAGVMHRPIQDFTRSGLGAEAAVPGAPHVPLEETRLSREVPAVPPPLAGTAASAGVAAQSANASPPPPAGDGGSHAGEGYGGPFGADQPPPPRGRMPKGEIRISFGQLASLIAVLVIGFGAAYLIFGRDNNQSGGTGPNTGSTGVVAGAPSNTAVPRITSRVANRAIQELDASTGTWTNSPSSFAYQWYRDDKKLAGQTSPSYTFDPKADVNKVFSVLVTATNASGSATAKANGFPGLTPNEGTLLAAISQFAHSGTTKCNIVPPSHPGVSAAATCISVDGKAEHGKVYTHFHLDPSQKVLNEDYQHNAEDELVKALAPQYKSISDVKAGDCSGVAWLGHGPWTHEESDPNSMTDGDRLCYQTQTQCSLVKKYALEPDPSKVPNNCSVIAWTNDDAHLLVIGQVATQSHYKIYSWYHYWLHHTGE